MSRVRKLAIGAFVALLAATPFIPRGSDSDSALRPSGERELTRPVAPGPGALTGAMRREIDRVVAAGRKIGSVSARQSPTGLASTLVRCAEFDGQRYCLHTGWTTSTMPRTSSNSPRPGRTTPTARSGSRRSAPLPR